MDQEQILRESAEESLLQEASRRRFLYSDVEDLIENGFLRHTVVLDGVPVTFRTFLPSDLIRIRSKAQNDRDGLSVSRWTISSAIWLVDGFEVSMNPSDNAAYHIYQDWIRDIPKPLVEVLSSVVIGLRNRLTRAIKITEAFCYEPYSRGLWRMSGRPTAGLDNSSTVKRLWVAYNLSEDQTAEETRQWGHTRAIVSSMASKGAKKLAEAMQAGEEKEEQRRRKVIEEAVNWIIQGDKQDQKVLTITINGRTIEVPKVYAPTTTEELEDEMRKVFSGEKDFHDTLVDSYHAQVRKRVENRREERHGKIMEARRLQDARLDQDAPSIVGYTRDQLHKLNPQILEQRTTNTVSESAQGAYVYDRYFQGDLKAGVLTPDLKVSNPDLQKDRFARPVPESDEEPIEKTLQEQISNRKPKIS